MKPDILIMTEAKYYWNNVVLLLEIAEREARDSGDYLDRAAELALSAIRECDSIQNKVSES